MTRLYFHSIKFLNYHFAFIMKMYIKKLLQIALFDKTANTNCAYQGWMYFSFLYFANIYGSGMKKYERNEEINLRFAISSCFIFESTKFFYRKKRVYLIMNTLWGTDDKVLLLDYDSEFCFFKLNAHRKIQGFWIFTLRSFLKV